MRGNDIGRKTRETLNDPLYEPSNYSCQIYITSQPKIWTSYVVLIYISYHKIYIPKNIHIYDII